MPLSRVQELPAISGSSLTNMGMTRISLSAPGSAVTEIDISLSKTSHDFYKLFGFLDNTSDNVNAYFRFLTDAGNPVGGGSDYHYSRHKTEGSADAGSSDNAHGFIIWTPTIGNSTNETGTGFEMLIGPCNSTSFPIQMQGQAFAHDEGGQASLNVFSGGFVSKKGGTDGFGGIRLYFESGNIGANSFVYAYGINKT